MGGNCRWNMQRLQVVALQARLLGNLRHKGGSDLVAIVEGKSIVGPSLPLKPAVRPALPCHLPPNPQQGSQQLLSLDRFPTAHATEKTLANGSGTSSPWSIQSAATRKASARTAAIADSRV